MDRPRIVVFGYSEMGARCLELLLERGQNVAAVYTHLDDPRELLWFDSVAEIARKHGIAVSRDSDLRTPDVYDHLRDLGPDLIFSFYYRKLIPLRILRLARLGAFNMHGSLLPKYRGRAPVNWAVLRGETETGATLHHMVARADAGDIVDQEKVAIGLTDTAGVVTQRVVEAGCRLLDRQLDALIDGSAPRLPQNESHATTFPGRTPDDGLIEWSAGARQICDLVRAVAPPFPGAFTSMGGLRLYVFGARARCGRGQPGTVLSTDPLIVACGCGAVELVSWTWRPPGREEPPPAGTRLSSELTATGDRA